MDRNVGGLRLGFIGYGRHARANLYPSIALAGGRVVRVATRSQSGADEAAAASSADAIALAESGCHAGPIPRKPRSVAAGLFQTASGASTRVDAFISIKTEEPPARGNWRGQPPISGKIHASSPGRFLTS